MKGNGFSLTKRWCWSKEIGGGWAVLVMGRRKMTPFVIWVFAARLPPCSGKSSRVSFQSALIGLQRGRKYEFDRYIGLFVH